MAIYSDPKELKNRQLEMKARLAKRKNRLKLSKNQQKKKEILKELLSHADDLICSICNKNKATINHVTAKIEWCSDCKYSNERCKVYGISLEDKNQIMIEQEGKCAICKKELTATPHIDHCHYRGHVRGLLCGNCNTGLGFFKDNEDFLTQAAMYVKANKLSRTWPINRP